MKAAAPLLPGLPGLTAGQWATHEYAELCILMR